MQSHTDDVQIAVAPANRVPYCARARLADFPCRSGEAIDAAHFLHGSRRDRKNLVAAAEQNDLLGTQRLRGWCGLEAHHWTPTGSARHKPSTRFSTAGEISAM